MDRYMNVLRWSLDRGKMYAAREGLEGPRHRWLYVLSLLLVVLLALAVSAGVTMTVSGFLQGFGISAMIAGPNASLPAEILSKFVGVIQLALALAAGLLATLAAFAILGFIVRRFGDHMAQVWQYLRARFLDHRVWMLGVGYFALQFARHWPAAQVLAIEKNPVAAEYLRQNVVLNGLVNVEVIESDCRDVTREADIVHLGYIGDSARFLPYAASQLRDGGAIILHDAFRRADYGVRRSRDWVAVPDPLRRELERAAPGLRVTQVARVKEYGPATTHLAIRLEAT